MSRLHCTICKGGDEVFRAFRKRPIEVPKSVVIPQKRPLNMGRKRVLTEEGTRRVMGNDVKRVDPWDRLEFFDAEDFGQGMKSKIQDTAKPVDRPHVVQAPFAHEYYLKELDKHRKSRLKQMIENGEVR